jgi:hypothetical protein
MVANLGLLTFREQHIVQEWGEEDMRTLQETGDNCSVWSFMPCISH